MSRRKLQSEPVAPPPTQPVPTEITVRTPETKAFDVNWDSAPRSVTSPMSNGHMGSVESLDDSKSRQPDLVIDFDTSQSTLTPIQPSNVNSQQEDQESVVSFVSSIDVSQSMQQEEAELGEQVQFNFQPSDSVQSTSATPTANIFAQAFKNPPKLKHVAPPTVKNSALDGQQQQQQPPAARNSVQAEKERIFEEQQRERERQERERQERERLEREEKERQRNEQQVQTFTMSQPPQKNQSPPTQTKKVHFSEVDLERRQLAASNYNKPASGFKPTPQAPPQPVQSAQSTFTPPAPISKPVAKTAPPATSRNVTQVARPKFRASANPVSSWNSGSNTTSAANLTAGLDKQLSETSTKTTPFQTKKWSPTQPVEVKKIEISDLPSPQSMQMYKPPAPRVSPPKPSYSPNHTGNSLVMDNLNSQMGYSNGNGYSNGAGYSNGNGYSNGYQQQKRISPPGQVSIYFDTAYLLNLLKTPPPPPAKPQKAWIPGMRADPNQFNIGKVFNFSALFFIFR